MVGIQLGTYSDKTTLPLLVHNLLTKHGSKHMAEALFGDVSTSSAKMYPYQVTQKLDVLGHVLDTWRSVLQYLQTNIDKIKDTWNLSDDDLTALEKVLSSADLKAFLNPNLGVSANILSKKDIKKWKDIVPVDQL
jgi:hypothetical protein